MNKLVVTEKFINTYYQHMLEQTLEVPNLIVFDQETRMYEKENLLKINGIRLEETQMSKSTPFIHRNNLAIQNTNRLLKDSLDQSLNNFMRSYSRNHKGQKNTMLSNYSVYDTVKRLPKLENRIFEDVRHTMQKVQDKNNQTTVLQIKHLKKQKDFEMLKRKVSQVYLRKKNQEYKRLDEFVPKSCDYVKEYLINRQGPEEELKNYKPADKPEDEIGVKRMETIGSNVKSKYVLESKNSSISVASPVKNRASLNMLKGNSKSSFNFIK